jgi:hypothetical protein
MSDFKWEESHIEWLSDFIKDKADITASSFGREDIPRRGVKSVNKQDRRNLMELVVKRGLAIAVVGKPNSNNYCICRIPEDTEKHHFNQQMLFDDRINDLPQSAWLKHPLLSMPVPPTSSSRPFLEWLQCKLEWLEIVNLLRVYQVKGQIGKENLQQDWDTRMQKGLLLAAQEKAKLYTLACLAWKKFDLTDDGLHQTPDDRFLDMLFVEAALGYEPWRKQERKSIRRRYEDLRQVCGFAKYGDYSGDYTEENAREKILELLKDITKETKVADDKVLHCRTTDRRRFACGLDICNLASGCNDPELKKAVDELLTVKDLMIAQKLSNLNAERKIEPSPEQKT